MSVIDAKIRPSVATRSEDSHIEPIGVRLKRLRIERGFSQRDLSSPGVSYAYISRIEAGARRPSVKALRMLAKKLGVTPGYLETGSDLDDAAARELRLADVELRLRLDEFRIHPVKVQVHAGRLKIVAYNTGTLTHIVRVEENHTDANGKRLMNFSAMPWARRGGSISRKQEAITIAASSAIPPE